MKLGGTNAPSLPDLSKPHLRLRSPKKGKSFLGGRNFLGNFQIFYRNFPGFFLDISRKIPRKFRPKLLPPQKRKKGCTNGGRLQKQTQENMFLSKNLYVFIMMNLFLLLKLFLKTQKLSYHQILF